MKPQREALAFGSMSVGLAILLAITAVYTLGPHLFSARLALGQGEGWLLRGVVALWLLEWIVAVVIAIPLAVAGVRILAGRMESRRFVGVIARIGFGLGLAAVAGHVALAVSVGSGWPDNARQWCEAFVVLIKLSLEAALGFTGARLAMGSSKR